MGHLSRHDICHQQRRHCNDTIFSFTIQGWEGQKGQTSTPPSSKNSALFSVHGTDSSVDRKPSDMDLSESTTPFLWHNIQAIRSIASISTCKSEANWQQRNQSVSCLRLMLRRTEQAEHGNVKTPQSLHEEAQVQRVSNHTLDRAIRWPL